MSDQAATTSTGGMPGVLDLVREALDSYSVDKSRLSLLDQVDRPTLEDLCLVLVDPAMPQRAAYQVLVDEYSEESAPNERSFYRFAADYLQRFGRVRSHHRKRLLRLTVADQTDGQNQTYAQLITGRLMSLAAEAVVDADSLEDIAKTGNTQSVLAVLDGFTRQQNFIAELELKRDQAEARIEKLKVEVEEKEQALQAARDKFEAEMKAIRDRVEATSNTSSQQAITDQRIEEARRKIFGS